MQSHRQGKKLLAFLLATVLILSSIFSAIGPVSTVQAESDNVLISQGYGGGGNNGATYKNDFIELYNPTPNEIDLTGWKINYGNASASSWTNTTVLTGEIAPYSFFLIQEAAGSGGTQDLPTPDFDAANTPGVTAITMASGGFVLHLVDASGAEVDLVSFNNNNLKKGEAGPALSNTTAGIRNSDSTIPFINRGHNTNNNANDFTAGTPDPRNSSFVTEIPSHPSVAKVKASPESGEWPSGTTVALSTETEGATIKVSINDGEYATYVDPITITDTTVIKAYATADGSNDSEVVTFEYGILDKKDIAEVRTYPKNKNALIEGVITHKDGAEMYVQDDTAAIVLYGYDSSFAEVGDKVRVGGVMEIYSELQELKPHALLSAVVLEENVGTPEINTITAADIQPLTGEAVEAQVVRLDNVEITAKNGSNVTATSNGESFIIYSSLPEIKVGEKYEYIVGVVKQFNANYQIVPLSANTLVKDAFTINATPGAGKIVIGSTVTLSSPTEGVIYYTLDGSEPTTESAVYSERIVITEDTTLKAFLKTNTLSGKVYTFNYEATTHPRIRDIQGKSHTSPLNGNTVENIEGVVTQIGYNFGNGGYKGFFIQDVNPDDDDSTSEAIFVYSTNTNLRPAVGDLVKVDGTISEYNEGSATNLLSTQLNLTKITTISKGNELPAPIILGKNGRLIPSEIIDNDSFSIFDPEEDAIDFFESLEGMLVKLESPTITSPYWTSGGGNSLTYNIATRIANDDTDLISLFGGLVLKDVDNLNPQRVLLAYGNPGFEVNTGDTFEGDITGVVGYNNGNFKVIPANGSLPKIKPVGNKQEVTSITPEEDKLLVASYNIENYYPGVGAAKTEKLAQSIANNLKTPDIVTVVEMQDSNGETNNGVVDADASTLIAAIKAINDVEYSYVEIAPENNKDGGAPGANIRVGFLYNPKRVTLAPSITGTKGSATEAVIYDAEKDMLSHNPGRIDPTNDVLSSSRKPIAAQFEFKGEKVIVIGSHFNSKSGDLGPFGITQPATRSSEIQRANISTLVNGFVKNILEGNENANIVVLGDLNDFQFSPAVTALKGNELDNLVDKLPANERYTYTYDGNSQVLDHILVSKNLTVDAVVDAVGLNADFSPSNGRVSDHDPIIAQLDLNQSDLFSLSVLHTNDTHANLDTTNSPNHIARRVQAILDAKAASKNALLVDAGDVFSGTIYFNKYEGLADLAFMNLVRYDAMTFGNHEFDKNSQVLATFIEKAYFPFVSSNIDFSDDAILGQLVETNVGDPASEGKIYPVMIKTIAGEKVGIIGLTTEDTENISSPGDVKFKNAIQSAKDAVATLTELGVNKVIALSHLGYEADLVLADEVSGIDIIVGGHSHSKLEKPVVNTKDAEPKLIVQTGEKGQFLGKLDVKFDENGVLTVWNGQLISVDEKVGNSYVIQENQVALDMLNNDYKPGIQALMTEAIGYTDVVLDGERSDVRTKETNLGNLIADGMLYAAQQIDPTVTIALQNGGGVRASIDQGEITLGEVLTVLPFNNDLVTIKVTGQEIMDALENGVSTITTTKDGRFPQIAGMRFDYDSTKAVGSRVVRVQVKENDKYVNINPAKSYMLATNAFTAMGGDFYSSFEKAYKDGRMIPLYLPDYDVFKSYIEKVGPITAETAKVDGRIVDLMGISLPSPTPNPIPTPTTPTTPTPTTPTTPTPTTPAPTSIYKGQAPVTLLNNLQQLVSREAPYPAVTFTDTEHWAKDTIQLFANLKLVNGYADGTFKPDATITRAEFVTIITRTFGLPAPTTTHSFNDVSKDAWYNGAINAAFAAGLVNGTSNGGFTPNEEISRQDIIVILSRVINFAQFTNANPEITDLNKTSEYAKASVEQAISAGVLKGNGEGQVDPKASATRAEAIQLILSSVSLDPAIKALLEKLLVNN